MRHSRLVSCAALVLATTSVLAAPPVPAKPPVAPPGKPAGRPLTPAVKPPATPAAATRPAAQQVILPPGWSRVVEGGRVALCAAEDETWVKAALAKANPATQPATRPADLSQRLKEKAAALKADFKRDLEIADDKALDVLIDTDLPAIARNYETAKAPVVYFVTTSDALKSLMKAGWTDPHLHYNRATDQVQFDLSIPLPIDGPVDESLLPALYIADSEPATRTSDLAGYISRTETGIAASTAGRCHLSLQVKLIEFIDKNAVAPLKLKPEQAWLGIGLTDYFAAKYVTNISGAAFLELMNAMTQQQPNGPSAAAVDLVRPLPVEALRESALPGYLDSRRKKAVAMVYVLGTLAGNDAPARVFAAVKKSPPADNLALIDLITVTTGQNLTQYLSPR